jgi:hypothetical protein
MSDVFQLDPYLVCDISSKLYVQRTQGKVDSSSLGVRFEINAVIIPNMTMIGVVLPLFMANPDQMVRTEGTRLSRVMEVLTM